MSSGKVRRCDLLVVGAGPAGAVAATHAARAGLDTLVVDRARFPRDKCCGDGLTTLALRELERIGLRPGTVASWQPVAAATIRSPSGSERTFPLPDGDASYAAIARRCDLDAAILDLARQTGAVVADGCGFSGVVPVEVGRHGGLAGSAAVTVEIAGLGQVSARWLIGADGMWSPLRRALGLAMPGYRGEWHALRQYFAKVGPRASRELVVWFEPDLLPAYAWSFPLPDGRANVGFGIRRAGRGGVGAMGRIWSELLQRRHVRSFLGPDAEPASPQRTWPIPARVGRIPLTGPRTLFVGDAAAVSDPMTGEGIGQALLTGRLAVEAIVSADCFDLATAGGSTAATRPACGVTAAYERRVGRELVADDRMARLLVGLLARPASARAALRLAGATDWTRRNFSRWMFEDYPRALLLTPRRWGRGMFGNSGAFGPAPPNLRHGDDRIPV